MDELFEEPFFIFGYNSHGRWSNFREIVETEIERENEPFTLFTLEEIEPYNEYQAIWVCPDPMSAFEHAIESNDYELSEEQLKEKYPDWEKDIVKINLLDTVFLKDSCDGDNGYLAVKCS